MSIFNYTTGNPANLVGGSNASMSDIQGPFTDLRAFINGANLDYINIAAVVDSYYKTVHDLSGVTAAAAANTYVFAQTGIIQVGSGLAAASGFRIDSTDFPSGSRTPKLRLRAASFVNTTAPGGITYTYGLYPITAVSGGAGAVVLTVGAVTAGSTVAIASPTANSMNNGATADFSLPSNGYYALGVVLSGGENAGSAVAHRVELQFRAV